MNKLFTKIAAACVTAAMAVGVGVAVSQSAKQEAKQANALSSSLTFSTSTGSYDSTAKTITWTSDYLDIVQQRYSK